MCLADDDAAEVPHLGTRAFPDLAAAIEAQLPPILIGRVLVVPPRGEHRFNLPLSQAGAQRVTVIGSSRNQAVWSLAVPSRFAGAADCDGGEGGFEKGNFRRGRGVQACSPNLLRNFARG